MNTYIFKITEELDGERLDKALLYLIDSLSRSFIQKMIREGGVTINGAVSSRPGVRLSVDDEVIFELPDAVQPQIAAENIPLDILYEDQDVIVVNKPKGMVVHPAAGHYSGTLVNALMYHCGEELSGINGVMRPGIVHRIDKDTTGALIACKNDMAHNAIADQLKAHTIHRVYHAICYGNPQNEDGVVNAPIGRHPADRKKMAVVQKGGKEAITHYHVMRYFEKYAYLTCQLETGRTHQIRVHMSSIGHPLLGDELYASGRTSPYQLQGQCLHAMTLGFIHPRSGEYIEVNAPLPEYFEHLLKIF
ncbi:MAG: RluA family pseudouridine synthase [Lachnospiraceae bacterium]|nr:RluA family pseudouridine synthase [Lachnospiraceae bacterium]